MKQEMYERMVPNQILDYYKGRADEVDKRIYERCIRYSRCDDIEDLKLVFPKEFPAQQYMGADPVVRRFQQMILGILGAKYVLEIGTFVGASTMSMARNVGENGHIWSIEKYDKFASIARENFAANGVNNITLLEGDAFEILKQPIMHNSTSSNVLDSVHGSAMEGENAQAAYAAAGGGGNI